MSIFKKFFWTLLNKERVIRLQANACFYPYIVACVEYICQILRKIIKRPSEAGILMQTLKKIDTIDINVHTSTLKIRNNSLIIHLTIKAFTKISSSFVHHISNSFFFKKILKTQYAYFTI